MTGWFLMTDMGPPWTAFHVSNQSFNRIRLIQYGYSNKSFTYISTSEIFSNKIKYSIGQNTVFYVLIILILKLWKINNPYFYNILIILCICLSPIYTYCKSN